jgi:Hemerythrin HHE cation binding domain
VGDGIGLRCSDDSENFPCLKNRYRKTKMQSEHHSVGPVAYFLADDHRRLEKLLQSALASTGEVAQGTYDQFRAGLLRHIGMEEKILLPTAQRLSGGAPLAIASTLRLDHGAIIALLMPTPTPKIISTLRAILDAHNLSEEGPGGWYETCDMLTGPESDQLMAKLHAAPEVAVLPHSDTPAVLGAVHRALDRAGYSYP